MPDKAGGKDRTFSSLDGAHGEMRVEIEIDGADAGLRIGGDLGCDLGRWREGRFDAGLKPPLLAPTNEHRASGLEASREIAPQGANLDPAPTRARADR